MGFTTKQGIISERIQIKAPANDLQIGSSKVIELDGLLGVHVIREGTASSVRLALKNLSGFPIQVISARGFRTTTVYGEEVSLETIQPNSVATKKLFGLLDDQEAIDFTFDVMTTQFDKVYKRYEGSLNRSAGWVCVNCEATQFNELIGQYEATLEFNHATPASYTDIAIDKSTGLIYAANSNDNTIDVFDINRRIFENTWSITNQYGQTYTLRGLGIKDNKLYSHDRLYIYVYSMPDLQLIDYYLINRGSSISYLNICDFDGELYLLAGENDTYYLIDTVNNSCDTTTGGIYLGDQYDLVRGAALIGDTYYVASSNNAQKVFFRYRKSDLASNGSISVYAYNTTGSTANGIAEYQGDILAAFGSKIVRIDPLTGKEAFTRHDGSP